MTLERNLKPDRKEISRTNEKPEIEKNKNTPDLEGEKEPAIQIESEKENAEKIEKVREGLSRLMGGQNDLERNIKWHKLENHVFNEEGHYRVVDEKGFRDFLMTGIVRSSPDGTDSRIVGGLDIGRRPTAFPSFDRGAPNLSYKREGADNYIFESNVPMYKRGDVNPVTKFDVRGRHWAYRPISPETGDTINEMTRDMIKNIYKLDQSGNLYIEEK